MNNTTLARLISDRRVWCSAKVKNWDEKGWSDCLVIPYGNGTECGIMLRKEVYEPTHTFSYQGSEMEGRMMVKVKEGNLIDPFSFRYSKFLLILICSMIVITTQCSVFPRYCSAL